MAADGIDCRDGCRFSSPVAEFDLNVTEVARIRKVLKVLRLLHLVSLKSIGGIQRDFTHFVSTQVPGRTVEHHTMLSKPGIAGPIQKAVVAGSASIQTLAHLGPFKIPHWLPALRQAHLDVIVSRIKPDAIVLWSTPRGMKGYLLPRQTSLIYYEHGAVWFNRPADGIRGEVSRFDGIICNSQASARMVALRWGVSDPARIKVCPNAVRIEGVDNLSTRRIDSRRPLVIGVAGRLEPLKGFALAVQATRILVDRGFDVVLRIAGVGPELDALSALIHGLDLTERVSLLGFVDDMAAFYCDIDAFVCPSIREPFGLVAAEAMAYGLPVICTAVDGLSEVVTHEISGLCLPPERPVDDYPALGGCLDGIPDAVFDPISNRVVAPRLLAPEAIAKAIEGLLEQPDRYEALSQGALDCSRARMGYTAHVCQVLDAVEAFSRKRDQTAGGEVR